MNARVCWKSERTFRFVSLSLSVRLATRWLTVSMYVSEYLDCLLSTCVMALDRHNNSHNIHSSVESLTLCRESGSSSHHEHEHENESMSAPQSLICLRALPADASEFAVGRIPSRGCLVRVPSECVRSKVVVRSLARPPASASVFLKSVPGNGKPFIHLQSIY